MELLSVNNSKAFVAERNQSLPSIKSSELAEGSQRPIQSENQDKVSISESARAALASSLGKELHDGQSVAQSKATAVESQDEQAKQKIDEIIAMLKKQLDELRQALQALEGDNTEVAAEKRKALESQIGALSAQLTELINQKLELEKKNMRENGR
ncbi:MULTISPECIES: hypothetical protein [Shewanella]|uniref:Uncharacterized protein n=1 Tax=Shewanella fidelis TaxID=173509 RepID=A0AAW8NK29_9GAMM|nr:MULTISPECIES: hypothetical protein [Shewanella]MDR8522551.1 hypothetical protein [Shewanella fidelis]MDW4812915.1 hypothetical protein [Shewanella fidelis]MDW4816826.1 hypothetical protein [Shewanella fidelis]MDW4820922.1 hypothetical protein [Shewanella fidelis]MDW4825543.1 hypothetical protein [Shewanella fidelis]